MSFSPGPDNSIADIAGIRVGHATDDRVGTGVTALLFDGAWTAAVDIRGGGPGVRETETLAVQNVVEGIHAICLSGGSVFGLSAADGVIDHLSAQGIGMRLRAGGRPIPIVPGAVLHDLNNAGDKDWVECLAPSLSGRSVLAAARWRAM
jgi:L-aminopeptidase/D-esterase-like protein